MIHERKVGDTLAPLNAVLTRDGTPIDLASLTVKFQIESADGTSLLAETTTGVTAHPTQTFTCTDYATNNWLLKNDHGVKEGQQVVLSNSGGALPSGLSAATRYFAVNVRPNAFRVTQDGPQGTAITIAGAGTGTHSFYVVGSVQYDFASATVTTAGRYRGWFTLYSGSEFDSVPTSPEGITIEVTPYGN